MEKIQLNPLTQDNAYDRAKTLITEMCGEINNGMENIEEPFGDIDDETDITTLCTAVHKADSAAVKLRERVEWYAERFHTLHLSLRTLAIQKTQNT